MRWLVLVALLGCRHAPAASDCAGATLIVTAMDNEMDPILVKTQASGLVGDRFVCGSFAGRKVLLAIVGVGPAFARQSTESLLAHRDVAAVVMVGIAGGLDRALRVGDVTVPRRWSRHDALAQWIDVDPALLARARARTAPQLATCDDRAVCDPVAKLAIGGSGVTGTQFVAAPALGAELVQRFDADVVDMETAEVAAVAAHYHVPFIAIRGISDLVWTGRSQAMIATHDNLAAANAAAEAAELLRDL
jgi:adenosylhomocysteine nucleosidase